jgi:large subunit ribosomal protein L34
LIRSNDGWHEAGSLVAQLVLRSPLGEPAHHTKTPFYLKHPRNHAMKRTYQPSKIRRARTHGFLVRMKSRGGRAVINARRAKGRKRLAV